MLHLTCTLTNCIILFTRCALLFSENLVTALTQNKLKKTVKWLFLFYEIPFARLLKFIFS